MVYPDNYEDKIGFNDIRRLVKGRCISSLGTEKVDKSTFSPQRTMLSVSYVKSKSSHCYKTKVRNTMRTF